MSRQSNYAALIQREARRMADRYINLVKQICQDSAMMAINDAYGIGAGRIGEFMLKYVENVDEMFDMFAEEFTETTVNGKHKRPEASMERVDRRMKAIMGDLFLKFEYRYGLDEIPDDVQRAWEKASYEIIEGRRKRLKKSDTSAATDMPEV